MTTDQELAKLNKKLNTIKGKTRVNFNKLETETEVSCQGVKQEYKDLATRINKHISTINEELNLYFSSDAFLKVDIETSQFDSDIRRELKGYSQWSPVDGCDVIIFNSINWSYKKAAAVLRQDPEKHASTTPVAKLDKWKLQKIVLKGSNGKYPGLLTTLESHQNALSNVENIISSFDDYNVFYGIIL